MTGRNAFEFKTTRSTASLGVGSVRQFFLKWEFSVFPTFVLEGVEEGPKEKALCWYFQVMLQESCHRCVYYTSTLVASFWFFKFSSRVFFYPLLSTWLIVNRKAPVPTTLLPAPPKNQTSSHGLNRQMWAGTVLMNLDVNFNKNKMIWLALD